MTALIICWFLLFLYALSMLVDEITRSDEARFEEYAAQLAAFEAQAFEALSPEDLAFGPPFMLPSAPVEQASC